MNESLTSAELEFCSQLEFTHAWIELGVANHDFLVQAMSRWTSGEDPNPEHYRYWAFGEFLRAKRPLSAELALALYELGDSDPDLAMGGAMMIEIMRLKECPLRVIDAAATSGRPHLIREIARRRTAAPKDGPD